MVLGAYCCNMRKAIVATLIVIGLLSGAGCISDTDGDDYGDAPDEIQDRSLDYQDYKQTDCPHLDGSLDQETMEKCNDWIRNNNVTVE